MVVLRRVLLAGSAVCLASAASASCSSPAPESSVTTATEAMSSIIHSDYGMTTFGGAGDYQSVACGGNSRTINQWYVASSQRYGCNKHLKLTANGKCLVVYTADAGPASWVEAKAGVPILDASPTVGTYLFNASSLGWSDLASHAGKYVVHAEITDLPVGPCGGSSGSSTSSSSSGGGGSSTSSSSGGGSSGSSTSSSSSGGGGSSTSSSSGGGSSGGGTACASDGACNPGNDGSGKICEQGHCVDGCRRDAHCPGVTRCVLGSCQ